MHKSDDDAFVIIKALQTISERKKRALSETIEFLKKQSKNYDLERATVRKRSLALKAAKGEKQAQKEIIKSFIIQLKVAVNRKENEFFNNHVCISSLLQKKPFQ